jgi:hypothetical protein
MIAGPYRTNAASEAERARNLERLERAALAVFRKGHVPVVGVNAALPLISVAGASAYDEIMLPLSLALAERCDAVLRIGGASAGADAEVERVRRRGGRVYASLDELPDAST